MRRRAFGWMVICAVFCAPAGEALSQAPKAPPKPAPSSAAPMPAPAEAETPSYAALGVPGLQIASHADLVVEAIDVAVAVDRITYTYRLRNKGAQELRLAASLDMPALAASADGSETYRLPAADAENPIALTLTADGAPIAAKPVMRAVALSIDRAAELRAAGIPLLPFGAATDKALASLSAEQIAKLVSLGLVSPPEPDQPGLPLIADWSLTVTHTWEQVLAPQKAAVIAVSYKPIAGGFDLNKETAGVLDEIKDDTCLSAATIKTLKARIQGKPGTSIPVTEITIGNESPSRWIDSPAASVTIEKPAPDVVVASCLTDVKSSSSTRMTGTAPDADTADALRIVLIGAAVK